MRILICKTFLKHTNHSRRVTATSKRNKHIIESSWRSSRKRNLRAQTRHITSPHEFIEDARNVCAYDFDASFTFNIPVLDNFFHEKNHGYVRGAGMGLFNKAWHRFGVNRSLKRLKL